MLKNGQWIKLVTIIAFVVAACLTLAPQCPDVCEDHSDCADGSYCKRLVGDCDGTGICDPKPEGCYEIVSPVCGCDDVTYLNNCYAAMAGYSVQDDGECPIK
ncbi:MAG: hypothetical protein P9L99_15000 [Candidatus Lernaella stagnicola]|nr:hypothetical protein [Candidatus Lernaella stagnicola]